MARTKSNPSIASSTRTKRNPPNNIHVQNLIKPASINATGALILPCEVVVQETKKPMKKPKEVDVDHRSGRIFYLRLDEAYADRSLLCGEVLRIQDQNGETTEPALGHPHFGKLGRSTRTRDPGPHYFINAEGFWKMIPENSKSDWDHFFVFIGDTKEFKSLMDFKEREGGAGFEFTPSDFWRKRLANRFRVDLKNAETADKLRAAKERADARVVLASNVGIPGFGYDLNSTTES
eukprot:GEZU01021691.1.p1 GENE.GEZU01021691.1~~GEZU01021691.1.p1  ORF type:complete len:235 (-),score=24.61 GEZU01021691.1:135-839(-)